MDYHEVVAFCSLPFNRIKVTPEGDVTQCCFQKRKCLGNILESSIQQIWNGPVAQAIRRETAQRRLHPSCNTASCPLYHLSELTARPIQHAINLPSELEIDLPSQHCNIGGEKPDRNNPACLMCERHRHFVPQIDRLREVCQTIKPIMKGVRSLHIQGIAEPFWKDKIFEILEWLDAEAYAQKLEITSTTNGTIINEERRRRYLNYPRSTITFSIDAATPQTYKLIRRLDLYDKVIENLSNYCYERKKPNQKIKIHNNINLFNVSECAAMVEVASVAGADLVEFNPTYGTAGISVDESNVQVFRRAQQEIRETADRLNMPVWFMRDFDLAIPKTCNPEYIYFTQSQIKQAAEIHWVDEKTLTQFAEKSPDVKIVSE